MPEVNVTQKMQELLSRLPRTDTHELHSRLNPEYTREHIALSHTPGNLLLALHRAREAQELAVSYRDFKVGAAVLGLGFRPSNLQIVTGVNVKPDEETNMNVHAEQVALQKISDRTFDAVSMVVVVGETQSDKQSGNEMPTLHPCGLCRGVMSTHPLVDPKASLIVSALPDFSKIEMYNLEALHAFHESKDASGIEQFSFPHLSIFDPAPTDVHRVVIEDTPELQKEEHIWTDSVGIAMMRRRFALLGLS